MLKYKMLYYTEEATCTGAYIASTTVVIVLGAGTGATLSAIGTQQALCNTACNTLNTQHGHCEV